MVPGENRRAFSSNNIIAIAIALVLIVIFYLSLADPLFRDPFSTVLEDRHGELLGARIAGDGQWRFPQLDSVPYKYEQCLLQFEDRFFYYHRGVNPLALSRAFIQNIEAGRIISGGSTISMQVIRMSRKGKPRSILEKLIEIFLASRLEFTRSKEQVLCLYASHAPYGGNVVGLDAASWRYFGRPPGQLTWAESATLAVLPNSPSLIHPGRNRALLAEKRNRLLERLRDNGIIDSLSCKLAMLETLPEKPHPLPSLAPHLLDYVCLNHTGERIVSTLDSELQARVNDIVEVHHKTLKHNEVHNASCLVLETMSGEVLAYVGNTRNPDKPEYSGDVDVIKAPRSTGSILKPLLFCLMLEEGEILTGSLVPDIPTHYTGYSPKNFNLEYDGAVPARRALARSLNIPAIRMLQSYGLERFYYRLEKLGMKTMPFAAEHYGLSLILGGAESNLWWITGMYASMGRVLGHYTKTGGYYKDDISPPQFIKSDNQNSTPGTEINPHPYSAASIWLTFQSLIEVNRPVSQAGWQSFQSSSNIAWKTGTSFGFRDAWAVGTSPTYTVGVWTGNADGEGRPNLTGIAASAPILFDVFSVLPEGPWFSVPLNELYPVAVCRQSGHLPGPHCSEIDTSWVPKQGLLSIPCPYHITVHLTEDGRYRVNSSCMETEKMRHESWFVLPPVQEWYYRSRNSDYRILPALRPDCSEGEEISFMELIYPRHSARVYVPRELDGSPGEIILEAAHRQPATLIHWHLNDQYLGSTRHIHQMGVTPAKGEYTLTLVDEMGNILDHHFEVVDR
ncbi:penicillin-binding protein 1C [Bacteroidota bacterium]